MRQIGSLQNESDAHRFGDYLLSAGMKNSVEQSAAGWNIWVEDDDQLDAARAELEAFRQDASNPRYELGPKRAQSLREAEAKNQQRLRRRYIDVRTQWGTPAQWNTPITIVLAGLSLLVGLATKLGEDYDGPAMYWLRFAAAKPPEYTYDVLDDLQKGQIWRLFTPIFIHYGALHLIFNLFWLLDLGRQIEMRRGSLFLLALVLVAAVTGNFAQYFWSGPSFGGMSGVVYALFGYVWMKGRFQPHLGMGVRQETVFIMIAWLLLCMTGAMGPIGNAAHVAGLIVGMAFGYVPYQWRRMIARGK